MKGRPWPPLFLLAAAGSVFRIVEILVPTGMPFHTSWSVACFVQVVNNTIPGRYEDLAMEAILWTIGLIFVGAIVVGVFIGINTSNKQKAMATYVERLRDFSATQQIAGNDGLTGMAIDEERQKICLVDHSNAEIRSRTFSYRDLLSCEIFEDGETVTKTSRSSQIGGALVGGLALGGIGAVIGGLSGKTKTEGTIKRVDLRFIVNDTKKPLHDINLMNHESTKDGFFYTQAIELARHWHGLASVLIKQADSEDDSSTEDHASTTNESSVADELKKLADLRDSGALSDEEFQQQKARLLA